MLAGFIVADPFEFIFISFITGVIAIFSLTNMYRRTKLFFSALMVFLSYSVVHFGISIMKAGSFENISYTGYCWFAGNGILILICYPLIFLFEKKFLFLSETLLLDLSDTNQPLLRRLAKEAPGSFQHSLQVANLSEEAARAVGAKYLLVRTGALYHDIGKIKNPEYYIENQSEGVNPHTDINPEDSGRIIINHVAEGVVLARRYKLPEQIVEFILTHHGTTIAYYFYKKYLDYNPEKKDMEAHFSYPGPKPFSKETAIMMMADAVEAASRTLDNYSFESISELVERIIDIQENDGQFSDTPLTFKDITEIKRVFSQRLSNIYHVRIAYPKRDIEKD
jgi:putative nucleotidyltransferase with HDIG domain